jgi:hypothetical protein
VADAGPAGVAAHDGEHRGDLRCQHARHGHARRPRGRQGRRRWWVHGSDT